MPVKDYLPIEDAKLTVEKEAKPKLTTAELTTVESPGKPVPATQLEAGKTKTIRKKKIDKTSPSEITPAKKDSILIITEKPQAAQKIAYALGIPKKHFEKNTSYYELERNNQKIIVASAVGHLFNLTYVKGQRGWPIFKIEWVPSYLKKENSYIKNYYDLLKKLSRRAKEIIVASVDYEEITPILEKGEFKLIKIGELVDDILEEKKKKGDILVPSFNKLGIFRWSRLKKAIKHKINENLYKISLEYGRKVKLTSSHNIFTLINNKIELIKTTDLKVGDKILCPASLPDSSSIGEISLLNLIKTEKRRDIYVGGKDVAKILKKRMLNKKRNDSALNETRVILTKKGISKIKSARIKLGYSTKRAANLTNMSQSIISLWENGLKNPTKNNFTRYLSTLEIGLNFIKNKKYCKIANSSFANVLNKNYFYQYKQFSNLARATIPLYELTQEEIGNINEGFIYGSKNKRNALPIKLKVTKELVRLMGYYLAEGDVNNNYRLRFSLGLGGYGHEKNIIKEIREFCHAYKIKSNFYLHKRIKHQIITIDNTVLALFFKEICKFGKNSREKTIPSLIFNVPAKLKWEFLRAFFLGDGSLSERNITFNTASEKLAIDISYLLMQLKIMGGISKSIHKTSKGGEIMWRITISNYEALQKCDYVWKDHHKAKKMINVKAPRILRKRHGDLIPLKIKSIEKINGSTGNVYDLSVKGENFVAGVGGVCCHNTDYDIEGEVIGWNIVRFICNKETAKRMKYSTLTKPELEKSYENTMPEPDWGQAYAGETRHILDWLYGINLSRALMSALKKLNSFKILSIGRVQGPALKIIIEREREISSFKPEPYWQVFAIILKEGGTSGEPLVPQEFKHPKDIFDKSELEKFKDIKEANAETKKSEEHISPPTPFDLTTLQREAYAHHNISPAQTLSIAQKLYLDGLISYPRTSSQKIPPSIEPKKILKTLSKYFPDEIKIATRIKPIEGKKSDPAHPSIFPTGEFRKLEGNDLKLYNLIVKRFISAFSPDAKTANKRIILTALNNPEITFTASGLKVVERGWTQVYPARLEEKDIPDLNGKVKIDEIKIEEKETQPPKRFTPASLITLLEKKNLGTKTTRSMIIDTLFERGYLDGKSIKATPLGMKLIEALEKYSPIIIDENLTRAMEEQMESIQKMKDKHHLDKEKEIIQKAEKIIIDISNEFKTKEKEIGKELLEGIQDQRKEENENNTIIQCPTCKQGSLRVLYSKKVGKYFIACSAYPNCRQTYSLPPNALIKKSDKLCPSCQFPKLLSIKKGKRPWEFCFNPNCEIVKKQREEWEARKAQWQNKTSQNPKSESP